MAPADTPVAALPAPAPAGEAPGSEAADEEAPEPLPLGPLTAESALTLFVERGPLHPEARLLAQTLRLAMTADYEPAGYWLVHGGTLGTWRVWEYSGTVEPADGTAELWELQHRFDLR